jgi:hypothetical protein
MPAGREGALALDFGLDDAEAGIHSLADHGSLVGACTRHLEQQLAHRRGGIQGLLIEVEIHAADAEWCRAGRQAIDPGDRSPRPSRCRTCAGRRPSRESHHVQGAKRAALYVRVSTDHQTVENQVVELRQVAERRGWQVVEVYKDAGISGAKGRDQRPGLDGMLRRTGRREAQSTTSSPGWVLVCRVLRAS